MRVTDPSKLNEHFNDLFKANDLEGMMNLYEEDAVLCDAPGIQFKGHAQIREQMKALLSLKGELAANQISCVQNDDLALLHAQWSFSGKDATGHDVNIGGHSSKVARRNIEGSWRYVIDVPVALP